MNRSERKENSVLCYAANKMLKKWFFRLVKNIQMQGARKREE